MRKSLKRIGSFRRRLSHNRVFMKGIVWWFSLSACLYLFSVVAAVQADTNNVSTTYTPTAGGAVSAASGPSLLTCSPYWVVLAFLLGVPLGMYVWAVVKRKQSNPKVCGGVMGIFFSPPTWRDSVSAILLTLLLAAPFLIFTIVFLDYPASRPIWWKMFLTNPGGLFALITGGGTLVGTYIAVQSILEMKHTITSYPQLLDRLIEMIVDAGESTEGVMCVSYSPLPGSWQVRKKLKRDLIDTLSHRRRLIKMICLTEEDHRRLLDTIASVGTEQKGKLSKPDVDGFEKECEGILLMLNGEEVYPEHMTDPPKKDFGFRAKPIRKKWGELPSYYFFVSEHRAIVVVPIGLPHLSNSEDSVATERAVTTRQISVETLGFETTDRHIVQLLQREFDKIAQATAQETPLDASNPTLLKASAPTPSTNVATVADVKPEIAGG